MWRRIGKLNFLYTGNLIIVASAGGQSIYHAAWARHNAHGSKWAGDADDTPIGKLCVSFETSLREDMAPVLVVAEADGRAGVDTRPLMIPTTSSRY